MKRTCAIILGILLMLSCVPALADVALPENPQLTDPALLAPIGQTAYAGWTLYQPTSSEIVGEDMTKDSAFAVRRFFPVVAVRDGQAALILLQRAGDGWTVFGTNETALNRPGLTLSQFTIDSNNRAEDTGLPVYFIFTDEQWNHYQLGMTATDVYTTRFDFLNFIGAPESGGKTAKHLFADGFMLGFNSGFSFTYIYHDPYVEQRYSMDIITGESDYDNFATFDLRNVPFSMHDAMVACTVRADAGIGGGRILLKQFNADGAATLCEIPEGAQALREVNMLDFQSRSWVLVAYGDAVGYLPVQNVVLD